MKCIAVFLLGILMSPIAQADTPAVFRKLNENKFTRLEVLPDCTTLSVQSGDPTKEASILILKAEAGCRIPWHWHTATEHLMIVSGSAKVEMKETGASSLLDSGSYALLPGKHSHQFTCLADCTFFLRVDGAFDIHYIDSSGNEIPADVALGRRR